MVKITTERFEEIITALNENAELTHEQRTDMLSELRGDFAERVTEEETHTTLIEELTNERDDLVKSHSKLFRQVQIQPDPKKPPIGDPNNPNDPSDPEPPVEKTVADLFD